MNIAQSLILQGFRSSGTPGTPGTPQNSKTRRENQLNDLFEERAAILEYDEGLPRAEAERLAAEQIYGRVGNAA